MIDTIGIPSDIFALGVVWYVLSSQAWLFWLGLTLLLAWISNSINSCESPRVSDQARRIVRGLLCSQGTGNVESW